MSTIASPNLHQHDALLLNRLQESIPLVRRPFQHIGEVLGTTEDDVVNRVAALKQPGGVIRQISAIFDSRSLGYDSCLVAAKVAESKIDKSAAIISLHPGVSHNYRRDHSYNLWYTIAVPPDSGLGLQRTVDILHTQSGASVTRLLPALKMYKIGVKFDLSGESLDSAQVDKPSQSVEHIAFTPTAADQRMICVLQQDLPIVPQPFDLWADQAQVSVDELLATAERYAQLKVMRRFSAVLHHRTAGFSANAMGAWQVPADECDRFGAIAAGFPAVTHCYQRPTYDDWSYSIFTMVHGTSRADCEAILSSIAQAANRPRPIALYSTKEYKKVRLRYFTPDIRSWEADNRLWSAELVTPN